MQRHSAIGERIVAAAPTLEAIAPIVRAAHERADGTGYPDGLMLEEIPICARIIAVVDAYDAMTSDRPYRKAMPRRERARRAAPARRHAVRPRVSSRPSPTAVAGRGEAARAACPLPAISRMLLPRA